MIEAWRAVQQLYARARDARPSPRVRLLLAQEMKPAWAFRIKGTSSAALDPAFMGLGPINACKQLILKSKLGVKDLDLIKINEAFSSQSIQVHREMGWNMGRVNVHGGAIAFGHPSGRAGAGSWSR